MKYPIVLLCFLLFYGCAKETTVDTDPPDLLLIVKSKTETNYYAYMNFPQYYNLSSSFVLNKNVFPAYFSFYADSAEYTFKNYDNRKEYYMSIKYSRKYIKDDDFNNSFLKFADFNFSNVNFDSVKLIDKELWLYCD